MSPLPFYIVLIAVAPMRGEPTQRSEQVTQVRLGELVQLIDVVDGWYKVKNEADGYVGYVSPSMLAGVTADEAQVWRDAEKFVFGERTADIYKHPIEGAPLVRTAVMSVQLPIESRSGDWVELRLPEGGTGWTNSASFTGYKKGEAEGLILTAKEFLGTPYLWGGRGSGGFDCSGFVQTVFELHGKQLPRDTSQQIKEGNPVPNGIEGAREGDLVFFSNPEGRVNHVGIYIGEGRVIHSSGRVHINSLNERDYDFDEELFSRYLQVRRIEGIK